MSRFFWLLWCESAKDLHRLFTSIPDEFTFDTYGQSMWNLVFALAHGCHLNRDLSSELRYFCAVGVLLPASRTLPGLASNAFWVLLARSTRPLRVQKLAHVHQIALQSPGCSSSAKGSGHTPAARDAADANQLLAAITTINNWCLGSQLAAVTLCVSCTSSASRTLSARNT